jgi:hypothetical protein
MIKGEGVVDHSYTDTKLCEVVPFPQQPTPRRRTSDAEAFPLVFSASHSNDDDPIGDKTQQSGDWMRNYTLSTRTVI